MKGLRGYMHFDAAAFFKDKQLMITAISEWKEFESNKIIGSNVEVVIIEDNTQYVTKNSEQISNRFEKILLKVAKPLNDILNSVTINSIIVPVNSTATVYGQYSEKLSVKCSDVKVVKPAN